MSYDDITITPFEMRERASEYVTNADRINGIIAEMDNLLSSLREEWEGAASQAYEEKFNEVRPGFVDTENLVRQIASALESTADAYEEVDQKIAAQYRQ